MRRATSRLELLRSQKESRSHGSVLRTASKKIMHLRSLQERQFVFKRTLLQDCEEGDLPSGSARWLGGTLRGRVVQRARRAGRGGCRGGGGLSVASSACSLTAPTNCQRMLLARRSGAGAALGVALRTNPASDERREADRRARRRTQRPRHDCASAAGACGEARAAGEKGQGEEGQVRMTRNSPTHAAPTSIDASGGGWRRHHCLHGPAITAYVRCRCLPLSAATTTTTAAITTTAANPAARCCRAAPQKEAPLDRYA